MTRRIQNLTSTRIFRVSGRDAEVFRITLTADTILSYATGFSPGVLYSFELIQDATGGRKFSWPSTIHNAPEVNPDPNSVTVATFVPRLNGQLYANVAAMYD